MASTSTSLDSFEVFIDIAIREIWTVLDKDNVGLVNEDYYIGQLKALDSSLSASSHERKDELHSWELEWRELMRMLHERSSTETTKSVSKIQPSDRYVSYENFYNSWLELAKNMTPQDAVPYFNRLVGVLKSTFSGQDKSHGGNKEVTKKRVYGENVYDKRKLSSLTRTSGDVFRLDEKGTVRATSRGKMTSQKIFTQWQKRQMSLSSPVKFAKIYTNHTEKAVNATPNMCVSVSSKDASERSFDNSNALRISKTIVKRALLLSHENSIKGRPESSRTLSLTRRKKFIASNMAPKYDQTFQFQCIPRRPKTSPLGKPRSKQTVRKHIRSRIRSYPSRSTRDIQRQTKGQKYSQTADNIILSEKNGGICKNIRPTMLRVLRLDGRFGRDLPRPHTAPSISRKGKVFKISPRKRAPTPSPFRNCNSKPAESICPQNYFHVHQLSPRGNTFNMQTQPEKEDYKNRRRIHPMAIGTSNREDTELQLYVLQKTTQHAPPEPI